MVVARGGRVIVRVTPTTHIRINPGSSEQRHLMPHTEEGVGVGHMQDTAVPLPLQVAVVAERVQAQLSPHVRGVPVL